MSLVDILKQQEESWTQYRLREHREKLQELGMVSRGDNIQSCLESVLDTLEFNIELEIGMNDGIDEEETAIREFEQSQLLALQKMRDVIRLSTTGE